MLVIFYAIGKSYYHPKICVYYPVLLKLFVYHFYGKAKIKFKFEQILRTGCGPSLTRLVKPFYEHSLLSDFVEIWFVSFIWEDEKQVRIRANSAVRQWVIV